VGALEDGVVVTSDGDGGCGEGDITSGIAQLPNGEERLCGKLRKHMAMAGCRRKTRNGEVSLMGGMQNSARGGVHGDWCVGCALVADWGGGGKEMRGTSKIGNGIKWSGGRTGYGNRK